MKMTVRVSIIIAPFLLSAPAFAVSNGSEADLMQTPFVAKVGGCTGTLIAPDRILTAAHCVDGLDPTGEWEAFSRNRVM